MEDIRLVDINKSNWMDVIFMTTNPDGQATICEEFVASNALSIVQSVFEENWTVKAVYADNILVGFTMYGYNDKESFYEICRIMIDRKHQRKGYGKQALRLMIDELRQKSDCNGIYLSTDPNNRKAINLYEGFGFKNTGKEIDDETLYYLTINKQV